MPLLRLMSWLLIALLCTSRSATAAGPDTPPSQDLSSDWMSYYYLSKNSAMVPMFLQQLQNSQVLDNRTSALPGMMGFLAVIFSDNPSKVSAWASSAAFTGKTKEVIERALWLSGNSKMIQEIFHENPEFVAKPPKRIQDINPTRPGDLDFLWGAFFASGNDAFPAKIVNVLDDGYALTGDAKLDEITRKAAAWSLSSNMRQHETVNRLLVRESKTRTGQTKTRIDEIIADNKAKLTRLPNAAGDFSALLILTGPDQLKEFQKPSKQQMNFTQIKSVKRGDPVILNILFTGMELNEDLSGDVSYTITLIKPNGESDPVGKDQLKPVKHKFPARFMIHNPESYIDITFDNNDALGKYKFLVTMSDNIGKKTIRMEQEIELVQQ
ncbi:hypothetical protein [Fundidesulfovibrio terrae]|uniref:hypothetical protein n=1 Tax=Fundidesulfovibrio terrae TaxID=2922866 RepID=UPI001FAF697A|nr:hypothetical protein [Fundidesulfovibrio terrae]